MCIHKYQYIARDTYSGIVTTRLEGLIIHHIGTGIEKRIYETMNYNGFHIIITTMRANK